MQNYYQNDLVVDLIDDSIISHADTIQSFLINQFLRAGIHGETINSGFYFIRYLAIKALQYFKSRSFDLDLVSHRPSCTFASSQSIDGSFLAFRAALISFRSSEVNAGSSRRIPDVSRNSTNSDKFSLSIWYRRFNRLVVSITICPIGDDFITEEVRNVL